MTSVLMGTPFDFGNNKFDNEDVPDHSADQGAISFLGFDMRELDKDVAILRTAKAPSEVATSGETPIQKARPSVAAALPAGEHLLPVSSKSTRVARGKPQGIRKRRKRKRVRRMCTVEGCPNRVVQGGVCVSHGAKRKQCKHPGCDRSVKKAGMCSTHGPARKKCEVPSCSRVAVQGGICIGHGAKKNQCATDGCRRIALENGHCKLHEHESFLSTTPAASFAPAYLLGPLLKAQTAQDHFQEIPSLADAAAIADAPRPSRAFQQTMYARGLSIFEEMGVESGRTVGNPLPPPPPLHTNPHFQRPRHRSTFSRDLQSLYCEDFDLEKFESI